MASQGSRSARFRRRLLAPAMFGAVAIGGLSASLGACTSSEDECLSTRAYFEQEVWSGFMSAQCTKCHTPDGVAVTEHNAKLVLQPSSYPGFMDANLATLREVSKTQYEGKSELLLKPLGKMNHGGGVQLKEDSPEYEALVKLVAKLDGTEETSCEDTSAPPLAAVQTLSPAQTLRKAALDLGGRLPTEEETRAVTAGGDKALDSALDVLMTEPTFLDRVREMYNDQLLTDKWLRYGGAALDFMGSGDWPAAQQFKDGDNPAYADRYQVNRAIAREPLNLIAYVVANDRPFTEILTASYALVNPFSARAYGLDLSFNDPRDPNEFQEAQLTLGSGVAIPHAGVLTTISFLNRWNTTPTNRNRARSRRVFQFFLATDLLRLAERPIDATAVTAEENPTMNSELCTVCHTVMDPVAGAFRGWDDFNYDNFEPDRAWHDDMFPPGFGKTKMSPDFYKKGLVWLGSEVSQDPRFAISAVYTVYKGLTGKDPIRYPEDSRAADFTDQLTSWQAQDDFFRETVSAFKKDDMNLKTVVKAIVKSVYYRGTSADSGMSDAILRDVGEARLLTPEMLNRKIVATTGIRWRKPWNWDEQHDWITEDYNILLGGIDSDNVPSRLSTISGVAASVATRMANEVACRTTAYDFTKPQGSRTLFPLVRIDEMPESAGNTVQGSVDDIKKNIQYLHERLLGESLDVNDEEITRTYQLFLDTWRELSKNGSSDMAWECQGRWDPLTGEELPESARLTRDDNFTVRSWLAVMTYMLGDYKFLYE